MPAFPAGAGLGKQERLTRRLLDLLATVEVDDTPETGRDSAVKAS